MLHGLRTNLAKDGSVFEDHGSTRIDLACPQCRQLFKVRLRKLQFGADLTCRLCRHEFSAREVSDRPEVWQALARMHQIITQRVRALTTRPSLDVSTDHADERQRAEETLAGEKTALRTERL